MSAEKKSKYDFEILQKRLQSISLREGIVGYILRGSKSASVDLKDPTKIINYAALSASAFEAGRDISAAFEIGEVDDMLLVGEDTKVLSTMVNNYRISIFMKENVDHNKVCKDLNLT